MSVRLVALAQSPTASPSVSVQPAESGWPVGSQVLTTVTKLLPAETPTAFVFCINQRIAANTNAHVIRETLGDIRSRLPGTPIHFVFDSQLSRNYAQRYLREVMCWPLSDREADSFIHIHQSAFEVLIDGRLLSSITYLENGKILFSQPVKHTNLKNFTFMYTKLGVIDSVDVSLPANEFLPTPMDQVFAFRGNILYVSDYLNTLFLLNSTTGKVIHRLNWAGVEAVDLYADYVKPPRGNLRYAREQKRYLMEHHRQDKPIYQLFFDGNAIWMCFGIQIMERTTREEKLSNGHRGIITVPKGRPIGSSYAMLAKLDTALRPVLFNYVPDLPEKLADQMLASPDVSFAVRGEALSIITNPSGVVDEAGTTPAGASFWLIDKTKSRFLATLPVPWPAGSAKFDREETEGKFINGHDVALQRETEPTIYHAYTGKPLARLRMPAGADSSTVDSVQSSGWFQLANGSLTSQMVGIVFRKNEQVVCNVFTAKFNYLQSLNLTSRFKYTSSVAVGDLKLLAVVPSGGAYVLRRYDLGPVNEPVASRAVK